MTISFCQNNNISIIKDTVKKFILSDRDSFDACRTNSNNVSLEDSSLVIHHYTTWDYNNKVQLIIDIFSNDGEKRNKYYNQDNDKYSNKIIRTKSTGKKNHNKNRYSNQEKCRQK